MTLKTIAIIISSILISLANLRAQEKEDPTRPNIIFILADDYGYMDTQAYAHRTLGTDTAAMYYETPNIDQLVAEGTAFSQAYANPLCSPTRASLLTGKYAARLGFTTAMPLRPTYYNQNLPVPEGYYAHDVLEHKDDIAIEQAWINGISNSAIPTGTPVDQGRDELSIAEALEDYHSAFIGKWHIGGFGARGYQPTDQGFEAIAWYDAGASAYYDWRKGWNRTSKAAFPDMPQKEWAIGDAGPETGEDYLTDDLTEQALRYLDQRAAVKDEPFFLYFSHFAVHAPYQGIKQEVEHFTQKDTKGWNGHHDPVYAAMVHRMDHSVGRLLNKLAETGLEENTLVIFMSDNGGIDSKITPKGDGTDNSPLLGGKACVTEGGIRVPLIFRWQGQVAAGEWVDVPVDCTDIYPTILQAAGYDASALAEKLSLDGQSVMPLLKDTKVEGKYTKTVHYWHYPVNVIYNSPYDGYPLTPHSAIRDGDDKLIFDWYGRLHLYNLANDPYEQHDLASQQPDRAQQLFEKLISWLEENVDQRYWPSVNSEYNPEQEVRKTPFVNLYQLHQQTGSIKTRLR